MGKEIDKLVLCPTYDYKVINCPFRNFTREHFERYHNYISNEMYGVDTDNVIKLLKLYYDRAFKDYVYTEEENRKYVDDNYWDTFRGIVVTEKLNTPANVMKTVRRLQRIYTNNFLRIRKISSVRYNLNEKDER